MAGINRQTVVGRLVAGVGGSRHGQARAYTAPVRGAGAGGGPWAPLPQAPFHLLPGPSGSQASADRLNQGA